MFNLVGISRTGRKGILILSLLVLLLSAAGAAQAGGPPTVSIAAPSNNFGDVGAALGNVWDMSSQADVAWTQPNASGGTVQYSFQTGVPGAYGSVMRGSVPRGSDLATAFYTNSDLSIPSQTYRYLIYRSYIANQQPGESGAEGTNGRILYSSQWGSNWIRDALPHRRFSKPHQICSYGVWCTYFFDLSQDLFVGGNTNPWDWGQPGARVEAFGLWPHENWVSSPTDPSPSGDSPNFFYLDYVYLTGEIVARSPNYTYTVRWTVGDPEGTDVTSRLYYQERNELLPPSQSPACSGANPSGWTFLTQQTINLSPTSYSVYLPLVIKSGSVSSGPFGSGVLGPFNQSYNWNLAASVAGFEIGKVYYVCVVAQDGEGLVSTAVSSAPVIAAPPPTHLFPTN